jgi:uncharacterized membrane protein YccF (DUF307 family)
LNVSFSQYIIYKNLKRGVMSTIGNFLWFIFGGIFMGLSWLILGCLMYITIIGIPWGRSCFVIGKFTFFPFGKEVISRKEFSQNEDIGTGGMGALGNVIWFLFFGLWLAIGHVISAFGLIITVIGIPFAVQHFKLAGISLAPIGKMIVTKEEAGVARKINAESTVTKLRNN